MEQAYKSTEPGTMSRIMDRVIQVARIAEVIALKLSPRLRRVLVCGRASDYRPDIHPRHLSGVLPMGKQVHLVRSLAIVAPPATVFARISDHENTPAVVDAVKRVRLEREGAPRNGLGAIRDVRFRPLLWPGVREEVVHWDAPHGYHYRILTGFPGLARHLGQWRLEPTAEGCRVTWDISVEYRDGHPAAWLAGNFEKSFGPVMDRALARLKELVEA